MSIVQKILIAIVFIGFLSCKKEDRIYILVGKAASKTELLTAEHLINDIHIKTGKKGKIIFGDEKISPNDTKIIIGTPYSNNFISEFFETQSIISSENFTGSRGGIIATAELDGTGKCIVLAGADVQGAQYAVYGFSKDVLGIDPLAYWTGTKPEADPDFDFYNFNNMIIPPPKIPILCYFENDVDELANLKEPLLEYDWESYTELVNSLVRLKYNAIHLFDMLGRPEFFLRDAYKKIRPDYDVRFSYIDSLINYAHDMGMMVAIDFSLGYKIRPMEQDKADCWTKNKQEWIDAWKYYFEETPLSKADIISFRPRNQVWDWPYRSVCGEDNVEVFNEVYAELDKVIQHYKPEVIKVVTCYTDGMEMFNNGLNPPEDWIIAWCDDGWGGFEYLPKSTKGYDFGAYMHAGFWLNHTVHDPYPVKIDSVMKIMNDRYGVNKYYEINGQQFRPFLLNIEAFARIADNPDDFNGEAFNKEWTERYFGDASSYSINALKKLHEAQYGNTGYVHHLSEIKQIITYLQQPAIATNTSSQVVYRMLAGNFETIGQRKVILDQALLQAEEGYRLIKESNVFYHDYIVLPIKLYSDLLDFQIQLQELAKLKNGYEQTNNILYIKQALEKMDETRTKLVTIINRRITGDLNPKWAGWYHPSKRRPNNGFPDETMLTQIENNLRAILEGT